MKTRVDGVILFTITALTALTSYTVFIGLNVEFMLVKEKATENTLDDASNSTSLDRNKEVVLH
jgi:hypothetical protein